MSSTKAKNNEIMLKNQIELRELEDFYINGTVSNLCAKLETKKNELVQKMIEYAKENEKCVKWSKDGDELEYKVEIKPLVISNYFFKSICPLGSKIPKYNAEKLSILFDYYMQLIAEVNDKIGNYPPTLSSFCSLAGITTATLREYRNSNDIDMRNIVEKIYDLIGDEQLTLSQIGVINERSTMFRLKSQHEMVEKVQPNVNITYKEVVNTDRLNSNLEKYKNLIDKKGK